MSTPSDKLRTAQAVADELQSRMVVELQPLLIALRFATEAARVLDAYNDLAAHPEAEALLADACSGRNTWLECDPYAAIAGLAWLAHQKGCELTEAASLTWEHSK